MYSKQDVENCWKEHYSLFFENTLDLLCIADARGYFQKLNPAFCKVLGYDMETLMSTPFIDFVHPEDVECTKQEMVKLSQGYDTLHFTNRYRTASGTYRHFSWSTSPSGDYLYASARDITELVEMQQSLELMNLELKESENKLLKITNALPVFVFQLDNGGRISFRNSNCQDLFFGHRDPIGKTYRDMFNVEACAIIESCIGELGKTCLRKEYDLSFVGSSGRVILMGIAQLGSDNRSGYIFTGWDVTQQRKQEEEQMQLRAATKAAQEASRLKSEFIAYMSHELRTPLVGIMGITELLFGTVAMNEEQENLAEKSVHCCQLLLSIINDILDLSKIEANKLDMDIEPFNLVKCIEDNIYLYSAKAQKKGLDVMSFIPSDVPEWVLGDKSRLEQVIGNLLSNAIKFTMVGSVILKCGIEPSKDEDWETSDGILCKTRRKFPQVLSSSPVKIVFCIEDTGIGMSDSAKKRMFEPFSQADSSTTRKFGGTGLGLTICRKLTRLMNGDVDFESEHGKGSRFWFSITIYPSIYTHETTCQVNLQEDRLVGVNVLLVDDQAPTTDVFLRYLTSWGAKVFNIDDLADNSEELALKCDVIIVVSHSGYGKRIRLQRYLKCSKKVVFCSNADPERPPDNSIHSILRLDFSRADLYKALKSAVTSEAHVMSAPSLQPSKIDVLSSVHNVKELVDSKEDPVRVLVVDDNSINQELLCAILRKMNISYDCAMNGQEAVELFLKGFEREHHNYDMILMDCQMPVLDGFGATLQIRQHEKSKNIHIPIIALTANAMREDEEKCLASGMDDYMTKPFKIASLSTMIYRWLRVSTEQLHLASEVESRGSKSET
jgi:PAS domain S-box-containing protein